MEENKSKVCEVCGATKEESHSVCYCSKANKVLCTKHRHQFETYGMFLCSTRFEENIFKMHDMYAEIELRSRKGKIVGYAKIDIEDVDKCKPYRWYLNSNGYIKGTINGKDISLHRFILNYYGPKDIDHINRNRADNRKCNLRIVTRSENMCNKQTQTNTGHKNIRLTSSNTYLVQIKRDRKWLHSKRYNSLAEAIAARDKVISDYNASHNRAC